MRANPLCTIGQRVLRTNSHQQVRPRARQQIANLDGDPVPVDHHRPFGDGKIVGQDADRVVFSRLELDDGASPESQNLMDGHRGGAEHDSDIDADFVDCGQESLPLLCANRDAHVTMLWLVNG